MQKTACVAALCVLVAVPAQAARVEVHSMDSFEDMALGEVHDTAVQSQGAVVLAPSVQERLKLEGGPILALVCDAKDTCFVAQGSPAKVSQVDAAGKVKTLLEPKEALVTALALDGKDGLFVATAPEGNVSRVDLKTGTTAVHFTTEAKHIWALAYDGTNLWVATGEPGALFKVTSKDTHTRIGEKPLAEKLLRSLAVLPNGKGIAVGGGRKGGVFTVDNKDKVTALYDASLEEVTALVPRADGALAVALVSQDAKGEGDEKLLEASEAGEEGDTASKDAKASEVMVIMPSGDIRRIWRAKKDAAYALAWDSRGNLLVGTGGRGRLYSLDIDARRISILGTAPGNRVTAIAKTSAGLMLATSQASRLVLMQAAVAKEGSWLSDSQDAEYGARLGRLDARADVPAGTKLSFQVRVGNTEEPDDTWSAWSAAIPFPGGSLASVPTARFSQVKATLGGEGKSSPELREIILTYRGVNNPPQVLEVTVLAPGVKVEAMPNDEPKGRTFTVSAKAFEDFESQPLRSPAPPETAARAKQTFEAGWRTVSWHASDEDNDELRYTAELLSESGAPVMTLGKDLRDPFVSFDESRLPDGAYRVRITASDAPSNAAPEALSNFRTSTAFPVDRTAPILKGSFKAPLVSWSAEDGVAVIRMECSLDGGEPVPATVKDGMLDGPREDATMDLSKASKGKHVVACRAEDAMGNVGRLILEATVP